MWSYNLIQCDWHKCINRAHADLAIEEDDCYHGSMYICGWKTVVPTLKQQWKKFQKRLMFIIMAQTKASSSSTCSYETWGPCDGHKKTMAVMMDKINILNIQNKFLTNQLSTSREGRYIVGSMPYMKNFKFKKYENTWDVKELDNFLYHMEV